jgi:hypothetical protein
MAAEQRAISGDFIRPVTGARFRVRLSCTFVEESLSVHFISTFLRVWPCTSKLYGDGCYNMFAWGAKSPALSGTAFIRKGVARIMML